ncbi:MAG: PIN domain-containing protein [Acidimicrobiia bacterium]|nr:PIN domain-containing protein [Acidimicrobiia bacterium]MDX2466592.1 PIN domain-containing protein [Acidimicrobiia bacterium]
MPVFIDTNVLVYAVDGSEPEKQATAQRVLSDPELDFVISAQVLSEFYVATTRRLRPPLGSAEAAATIGELRRVPVVAIDDRLVAAAIDTSEEAGISLRDAQIIQAAARSGCDQVLTEDLNDGQTIAGVQIRNPFG